MARRSVSTLQLALASALAAFTAALAPAGAQARAQARAQPQGTSQLDLVVAATTDVHGRLRGWDYFANEADPARGLSRVATMVDSLRQANPGRVLLVDAGDLLQGNPIDYVAARVTHFPVHPVMATMNVLRYDAAVIGNHEFNYGFPVLDAALKQARFPFLAANVHNANGAARYASTTLVRRSGVKVAIIGATTPGSNVWDRDNLRAARVTVSDIVPAVRSAVRRARQNGADVIVVLLHSGFDGESSYDTVGTGLASENVAARVPAEVPGIDLVVFGHSHKELVDTTINGALLMQPRNWAASVAVATLALRRQNGRWKVTAHHAQSLRVVGHAESPAVLAVTEAAHQAAVTWSTSQVGRSTVAWHADSARVRDTPIIDFMLDVMRRETHADLAATAAFSLDASIDSGSITIAEMARLYPYDNTLRAVRISGATLRAFLEHSSRYYRTLNPDGTAPVGGVLDPAVPGFNFDIVAGADYTIDLTMPVGKRITQLTVHGKSVVDSDSFTMALNNYRQSGGGGYTMLAGAPVTYTKDVEIRQLLIDEVKRVGTLKPETYFTNNWHLEPASAVQLGYRAQNRGRAAEAAGGEKPLPMASRSAAPAFPSTQRVLRLISTSDFHGAIGVRSDDSGRKLGGALALSAAIARARAECRDRCTSIVVDGGDLFTGSPQSDWDGGKPSVAVINQLGISAGALGNHEFDFGQDTLRQRLTELKYRVLAINVVGADGQIPAWIKGDTVVVRDGLRIGIIGAAGMQTPASTKKRNVNGLTFLDPAPLVSARIKAMRAQGIDAVIVAVHDGGRCDRDRPEVCTGSGLTFVGSLTEKPDAVVLAHAHTNIATRIAGIPAVQVTNFGRAIGVVDIPLAPAGTATVSVRDVPGDSLAGASPVVDSIVKASTAKVESRLSQPVATLASTMLHRGSQYALGNLMADMARVMGNGDMGAWNNGGIRTDLRAGPLTFGQVHEVSPFGNVLVRLRVRGKDLDAFFERMVRGRAPTSHVSGVFITYDSTRAPGQRIVSLTRPDGSGFNAETIYTIVINDFMLDDPELNTGTSIVSTELLTTLDDQALAEYLRRQPQPVQAPMEVRIKLTGAVPSPR